MVLLLDAWERMVNVQYLVRRLVHVAQDAHFALVEPFMFASKVWLWRSLPPMFAAVAHSPQPASAFLHTAPLLRTGHYVRYQAFRRRARLTNDNGTNDTPSSSVLIDAALFLEWTRHTSAARVLWRCDARLRELPGQYHAASRTHRLASGVHVASALCAWPTALTNRSFFGALFAAARAARHTSRLRPSCALCTSVALVNFRKHALRHYTSVFGDAPTAQRVPPLAPAPHIVRFVGSVARTRLRTQRLTAFHLRAGKAFTLLAVNGNDSDAFVQWIRDCAQRVVQQARATDEDAALVVASDLFSGGWTGGERQSDGTTATTHALQQVRKLLNDAADARLAHRARFGDGDGDDGVLVRRLLKQDAVGAAAALDAAFCVRAHRFVGAMPSSFARWVCELRAARGAARCVAVRCPLRV
ncbi:unnamed protein product [Agarophyton chilense]